MGEVNDEIREQLQNLIEGSTIPWTYAILWQCSFPQQRLNFESGYYRGMGKAKEVRILGSCVSVTEEVTDAEWFFKISMGQSFGIDEDLPGFALVYLSPLWVNAADTNASSSRVGEMHKWGTWERTKWGHQFGIQTFLCLRLRELMVLELASTQIIPYHHEWIKHMENLPSLLHAYCGIAIQLRLLERERKRLPEISDNEMQNRGNDNLSKLSRGKEKISDSKCSWSLLTESSDRGTDRTFSCSQDYSGPS